ncbi:hypothetical protein OJ996_13015 [Luteolibacter sp. GHJ8]|uniref:SLA1 homology domain-containing protein n=1 Tax=Luteolibacter rhizosphaerae TaxID=2989719 RepID=A0ABT3G3S8_9BACT|nr:hypothetical protein [Luteolibacter rhizosphaerae]MCW1914502.1 hypothetical protein [Luteolibacter rhizosphaerae]
MKRTITSGLLAFLLLPALDAAETRIWTSRKGSTIEAELLRFDETNATLLAAGNKQIVLPMADLSIADRQFMVENVGADAKILVSGEIGEPEKQVKIDSSTFKKLKESNLIFGTDSESAYELMESEHFLIATAGGVRPQAIAETAERMWHGMAFQHMNFRRDWGDKRMLILLVEDREAYTALGKWWTGLLKEKGNTEGAANVSAAWDRVGSTMVTLPDEMADKHKVFPAVRVFNVKEDTLFKKPMGSFLVFSMAGVLLDRQLGNISSYGVEGLFAVNTGHSYYKEISLTGKSETSLLSAAGTGEAEVKEKKGFGDASDWAKTLRGLVKKGEIKCEVAPMFKVKNEDVTPEQLALMYSFSAYMESTPARLACYASMVRRIESSKQIPVPEEIAKIFGFETVAALEADWKLFVTEGKFK